MSFLPINYEQEYVQVIRDKSMYVFVERTLEPHRYSSKAEIVSPEALGSYDLDGPLGKPKHALVYFKVKVPKHVIVYYKVNLLQLYKI